MQAWFYPALFGVCLSMFVALVHRIPPILVRYSELHCVGQQGRAEHAQVLAPAEPATRPSPVDVAYRQFPSMVVELKSYQLPSGTEVEGAPILNTSQEIAKHFGSSPEWIRRTKQALDHYTSDKARAHAYHYFYAGIFENFLSEGPVRTLEVGMGTNNTKLESNMGSGHRPGASQRAFRDLLPQAKVYGADVDADTLFEEERIKTHWVDQLQTRTLEAMLETFGIQKVDLFVIDGLHRLIADLNTFVFALKHVNLGGWVVVEDMSKRERTPEFWVSFVDPILRSNPAFRTVFTRTNYWCYIVQKVK